MAENNNKQVEGERSRVISRHFACPQCGDDVRIPTMWLVGIESVFVCNGCGRRFLTGYRIGAFLFGISFTLAIVTANIGAYLLSSVTIPLMAVLTVPLWIFYGFILRRWWLLRRTGRAMKKED